MPESVVGVMGKRNRKPASSLGRNKFNPNKTLLDNTTADSIINMNKYDSSRIMKSVISRKKLI